MPNIVIPPLGSPLAKVEKMAEEVITYYIDLTNTLDKNELISSNIKCIYGSQPITSLRSRKGKTLEITIPATTDLGAAPSADFKVTVQYSTTTNKRSLSFIVKVYR